MTPPARLYSALPARMILHERLPGPTVRRTHIMHVYYVD